MGIFLERPIWMPYPWLKDPVSTWHIAISPPFGSGLNGLLLLSLSLIKTAVVLWRNFDCIFVIENVHILCDFFLVHGVPSLVQLMDWSLFGVKLLFEVMLTNCVKFYIVNGLQCNNVLQYFCKEQNVIYAVDDKPRDIPLSIVIYI